ncbi:hypothetical protein GTU67_11815 [Pusillimonas sp. 7-48]|uniref:Capsule polysaccharide biosynthesis protein n=2 Tax=Pusillimonas minor TaxID=2697024 RepID=A0A842HSG0_9BURK|nr:hypothetical protein [Pusillimonas minor]
MHSAHIAYAYLADEMAKSRGAQIKAYAPRALKGIKQKLSFRLKALLGWAHFGTYKSFGANEFLEINLTGDQRERARLLYEETLPRLQSTRDVEDMHIKGVWIGDLVYDTYLMSQLKPTINPAGEDFKQFLLESLELYTFWDDYLNEHNVCGVNVSHCVYNLAIPLRLAVYRDIPAFQANVTHVYRLSRDNLFAYNDFFHFRERFAELPEDVREAGLALAQRRIQRRFSGEVGVDMAYSTKSAYVAPKHSRLLRASDKKKILIATHCFFDSPHSYGKNIFPDFYEWLEFLGKMTECTDYDWYVKTHPDFLPGTKEIIDSFVARYPKFTLLPADASHHQIIAEGINFALTSYGTIAFEYAALGIPVINASMNNPHIAYDFNLHPPDPDTYRSMLLDLDKLDFHIDTRQVYEYYFMRHIYNTEDIFFEDYEKFIQDIGGYNAQFTYLAYKKWLAEWTPNRHEKIVSALHSFVASGKFRMDYTFYGQEFSVVSLGDK